MKIFRWKFIIPTAVIISAICVFFVFYLDVYLKKAFISSGELIFGAKVEVGRFKTKFKGLNVNIKNIKIGDKDNEFKNLADIDNVNFSVRFIPLLSKKIIIDDMSAEGIKWGTARKTSCKLPPKKKKAVSEEESFASKAVKELKAKAAEEYNSFPGVRKLSLIQEQIKNFSPESIVDMAGIQSVSLVQNSYVELMGKYDSYNKIVNDFDVKAQIDAITALTEALSKTQIKTPADIQTLKNNLAGLNEEKKKLEKTFNELQSVKNGLVKDAKQQQDAFKNIGSVINRDVDNIASKLSIPSLDFRNISRMLFGWAWVSRVDKVLYYMSIIRKYMPEKSAREEKKPEPKKRLKGIDMVYPVNKRLPGFFIAKIKLSGTSGGEGKEGTPVFFSGTAENITSNQKLTGKKTTFEVKGGEAGGQTIAVSGSFSRITDVAEDILSFTMEGVDAVRLGIPETDYTPSFKEAKSRISAQFSMIGSDFITKTGVYIDGMYYDASQKNFEWADQNLIKYVNMLWQGINSMSVEAKLSILKEGGIKAEFMSDIDKKLGQRFDNILKSAVGDVKVKIRKEVTQYVDSQKKVLQAEADKYVGRINKELEPKLNEIRKKIDEAKKLISDKENELKKSAAASLSSFLKPKKDSKPQESGEDK